MSDESKKEEMVPEAIAALTRAKTLASGAPGYIRYKVYTNYGVKMESFAFFAFFCCGALPYTV